MDGYAIEMITELSKENTHIREENSNYDRTRMEDVNIYDKFFIPDFQLTNVLNTSESGTHKYRLPEQKSLTLILSRGTCLCSQIKWTETLNHSNR